MNDTILQRSVNTLDNIDDIIDVLIIKAPRCIVYDTVSDAILVEHFFSTLSNFDQCIDIDENDITKFKEKFDYNLIGLKKQDAQQVIQNMRSINRIIDTLTEMIPQSKLEELARNHIKKVWFEQNAKGDLETFKQSLNYPYWIN